MRVYWGEQLKIDILGTDSSHANAFAQRINTTGMFPNVCVTHIFGLNRQETDTLLEQVHIENVVNNPDEMPGKVDGVMIVFRDGNMHAVYKG